MPQSVKRRDSNNKQALPLAEERSEDVRIWRQE